jgi:Response regulator containing a CheY-like receiver domain and a GGDEF domain
MSLGGAVCEAVSRLSIPHQDSAYGVMTISVGLARGRVGEDLATILMAADDALYRAKHAGRNRVES